MKLHQHRRTEKVDHNSSLISMYDLFRSTLYREGIAKPRFRLQLNIFGNIPFEFAEMPFFIVSRGKRRALEAPRWGA